MSIRSCVPVRQNRDGHSMTNATDCSQYSLPLLRERSIAPPVESSGEELISIVVGSSTRLSKGSDPIPALGPKGE